MTSARHARTTAAAILAIAMFVMAFVAPRAAGAVDRRVELAARDALHRAEQEFQISDYDKGIGRLERALRACGSSRCGPSLKAQLWRDLAVMQLRKGEQDDALTSLSSAFKLDATIDLNPTYEADDTRALFQAAKDLASAIGEQQPSGDFAHTPAAEQVIRTPVPVVVTFDGSTPPDQVVVKYKSSKMTAFKRIVLPRKGPKSWAGLIPCGDVTFGVLRYYIQGFDAHGEPVLNSGDPKRPYFVPIRPSISSEAPSLPGSPPPRQCTDAEAAAPAAGEPPPLASLMEDGGQCTADAQCKSEVCEHGKCAARFHKRSGGRQFARVWVGVSGAVDWLVMPKASDVCLLGSSGQPSNAAHYYCTDPNDGSYPKDQTQNGVLRPGSSGDAKSGIHSGDVRAMLSVDFAATGNLLLGARFGYVFQSYPGTAAVHDGREFSLPLHIEARVTYIFGADPLVRTGFAPYLLGAAGVAPFDASQTVMLKEQLVMGQRPILAWVTGGPAFVSVGGGARYAFSARAAFLMGLKLDAAIGAGGVLPVLEPELGVQLGF